jgi:hypothetical protein
MSPDHWIIIIQDCFNILGFGARLLFVFLFIKAIAVLFLIDEKEEEAQAKAKEKLRQERRDRWHRSRLYRLWRWLTMPVSWREIWRRIYPGITLKRDDT